MSPGEIEMVDDLDEGRRPLVNDGRTSTAHAPEALAVCPGIHQEHSFDRSAAGLVSELTDGWGPVYEVWEGCAADPEIRFAGSSGGAASALALFGLEHGGMYGVLHTAARPDAPYLNHTVLSRTRADILAATGSRYAPASACDGLQIIEDAPAPCVFIGKPCDVAAVQKARRLRPALDAKVGLTIAFFCAGTPSTRGALDLLRHVAVDDPRSVTSLRYRGHGWPGRWTVRFRDVAGEPQERNLSYEESWGFLTTYVQWRCRLCPDHTGEFADLAVGDPWYRPVEPGEPGTSLIVARTPRGRAFLHAAAAAGAVTLEICDPTLLPRSQPNLLRGRAAVWGRRLVLRSLGIPVPRYVGLPMFRFWLTSLSLSEKLRSTFGTLRRVFRKRVHQPTPVVPSQAPAAWTAQPRSPGSPQPQRVKL
jgi:coenzyme F420 hydrogenase subunit beta